MHYAFHRDGKVQAFQCYYETMPSQDTFIEWQANEGAAELLVPYRLLMPEIERYYSSFYTFRGLLRFRGHMASKFNVSPIVIRTRLESLRYEISQYLGGTPIPDLRVLSNSQQMKLGLGASSLNEVEDPEYEREICLGRW